MPTKCDLFYFPPFLFSVSRVTLPQVSKLRDNFFVVPLRNLGCLLSSHEFLSQFQGTGLLDAS